MNPAANPEMDPETILKKLKQLFLYYSSVGSQGSISYVTPQKLLKLFKDSNIPDKLVKPQDIDLLIISEKRKQKVINFEVFCNILSRVAKAKFPEFGLSYSTTSTLYALLDQHIFPLIHSLVDSGEIKQLEDVDSMIDEECFEIINSTYEVLREIYTSNFAWELISSESEIVIYQRSKQAFMSMLAEFNVTPDLIGLQLANKLWQELVENPVEHETLKLSICEDIGSAFTLKKFILFLLRSAMLGNYSGRILGSSEKLSIFLERLEMSKGFSQIDSRLHRPYSEGMTLLSIPKVMSLLNSIRKEDPGFGTASTEVSGGVNISDQAYGQLEIHMEQIEAIFRMHCAWGDHMNNRRLNSSKFGRLLASAGLIAKDEEYYSENQILASDAHLIFVSVTHKKSKPENTALSFKPRSYLGPKDNDFGKMSFPQFLKALELISTKIYVDLPSDQAFLTIIENHILTIDCSNSSESYLRGLLSVVRDPNMGNIINVLHRTLSPYIRHYLDKKRRLDFPQFIKFCTDFSIFPEVIAKAKLTPIFYCLADIYTKNTLALSGTQSLGKSLQSLPEIQDPEFIDVELFIDLIAMAAIEGNQMDKSPNEKIYVALEIIAQSKGPSLVPLKTGAPRSSELHKSDYLMMRKKEVKKPTPVMTFRELLAGRADDDI